MALTPGTRIGPYEVTAKIGEGGMGEVYKATDMNLKRAVALKVLPASLADDPDRLARFQREAEVLAALNHPNIAQIHGLEKSGPSTNSGRAAMTALVMELVEGPTLADILAGSGPLAPGPGQSARPPESQEPRVQSRHGLPLDDALPIAKQIADALEAAHEQGIIHRDLKPANIKVRPDGTVKVLDFGLAKAMEAPGGMSPGVSQAPTITTPAMMTGVGMILGTAAYMSPEQARGKPVDKRSDIWAFGCVLYEMLAGKRAFDGEDVSETLANVLKTPPDWTALPSTTPAPVRRLLRRCLDKDRRRRLSDIGDARLDLDDALSGDTLGEISASSTLSTSRPARQRVLPWALTGVLAIALASVISVWAPRRSGPAAAPLRVIADLGADASLVTDQGAAAILSADGAMLAFVAQKTADDPSQLYVRRLDGLQATAFDGTDGARNPFFSPDGKWIGFFADGALKKISTTGGAPITLCDAPNGRGGAWGDDGTIAFMPNPTGPIGGNLLRVSSDGGKPEPLTTLAAGELTHRWPQFLPKARGVLYTASRSITGEDYGVVVRSLPNGERKVLVPRGYYGRYVPGYLLYVLGGTLFAAEFDVDRLEVTSPAVPVLEGVRVSPRGITGGGAAQFAMSDTGILAYVPGRFAGNAIPISWMDRAGRTAPLLAMPYNWSEVRFSPDGNRLLLNITTADQTALSVYDWQRDVLSRVGNPVGIVPAVWSPDGQRITFGSGGRLYWQRADGSGGVQPLTPETDEAAPNQSPDRIGQFPFAWHPSGEFLAFGDVARTGRLMILPMDGDETSGWKPGKPTILRDATPNTATFSPDGRWLAYAIRDTGIIELFVEQFPGPGARWQISTTGGNNPVWSRTRQELFFGTSDGRIMVVRYSVDGDTFRAEKPEQWSDARFVVGRGTRSFDLHPDGERFALGVAASTVDTARQDTIVLVFNFGEELRRERTQ